MSSAVSDQFAFVILRHVGQISGQISLLICIIVEQCISQCLMQFHNENVDIPSNVNIQKT